MAEPLDRAFVLILPDFSQFARALRQESTRATKDFEERLERAFQRVERVAARAGRDIADELRDALDDIDVDIDVDPRQVEDEVDDAVRRADPPDVPVNIDVDREGTFSRFISSLTGIRLPIAGFAALGAAVAAAAGAAVQLAAALAPAVGIIAAAPATIGGFSAAIGTLRLALLGVGEAFEIAVTGDAQEFEEAIENLAPAAQDAARAVRELAPTLTALQDSVQQAFFEGLAGNIDAAANALLGPFAEGAEEAARLMGDVADGLLNVAASSAGVDFVTSSFATLNNLLAEVAPTLDDLFAALLNLGTAVNEAFGASAGEGIAGVVTQLTDFINAAVESGEAVEWVEDALAVFQALGDIISPIVGIIRSIGDAASETGGNALGVLGEALQVFDDFLASAEGQDTLINLFDALNTVGGALGDVLNGIAPALPPIIEGLGEVLDVVAPLLGPLGELVGDVLIALAPILGAVAAALQPLIGPLTRIIEQLGVILVRALNTLMPFIEDLLLLVGDQLGVILDAAAQAFEALAPAIFALLDALVPLLESLTPLLVILTEIQTELLTALIPVIEAFAEVLTWLIENVITPIVIPILQFLIELLGVAIVETIEGLTDSFTAFGEDVDTAWTRIKNIFVNNWNLIRDRVFTPLRNGVAAVNNSVLTAIASMRTGWNNFVTFIRGVPERIRNSLSNLFSPLASGFRSAINSVIDGWNSLSFTVPSIDLGALGEVGGFTVSTPNIPRLRVGGMSMGEGLAYLDPNEAILPLEDSRTENLLAGAIQRALVGIGAAGTGVASMDGIGDIYVDVRIGETELNDIVDTRINVNNKKMVRRARAATGRTA